MPDRDVLLIPWRGGNAYRERNLSFVLDWYSPLGLEVFLGDSGHEPFNRGDSRNAAAQAAGDWSRALIADADCLAELDVEREAFNLASQSGKLILPHHNFFDLTKKGTEKFMQNPTRYRDHPFQFHKLSPVRWAEPLAPSGALVLTHEAYDAIGGYDPGFRGWGYEDTALLFDADRTVGHERLPGLLVHLYHMRDRHSPEHQEHNQELARKHREG
jgi:predicted glycosyltransferase involved in capsule biosynthesis